MLCDLHITFNSFLCYMKLIIINIRDKHVDIEVVEEDLACLKFELRK